ncbi:MAG: tRNA threonylcarbamoyladenosine dehydratase [Clostridia bacterium]|nr:tRNA threonylcarbamoyladenosine dehydratase [Clostridia bacterium]
MADTPFMRLEALIGKEQADSLKNKRVAVFGIGGVGSYTVEALARSGIGSLFLVDNDTVSISNINRQLIADFNTVGQKKTSAAKQRILSINPAAEVEECNLFFSPDNSDEIDFTRFDYVVDAIDSVTGKIELVMKAAGAGVPVISCMGTGNKLDPTRFEVADIYKTSVCPLARVMRRELKNRGIKKLKVVYSKEEAITPLSDTGENGKRSPAPASCAFVPSVAGLIIAGEVVKDLIKTEGKI